VINLPDPIRWFVRRWTIKSTSRKLITEAGWDQKNLLLVVFLLGLGGAVLEGATFALLALTLELLSSDSALSSEKTSFWGISWLANLDLTKQFVVIVASVVLCQVIKSVFQVLNNQLSTTLGARTAFRVQQKVLDSVLALKFSTASRYKIGELTNMVATPADSTAQLLIQCLAFVTNIITSLAYVLVMCLISVPLFLAATILFSIVLLLQKFVGRKIGSISYQLGLQQGDLTRKMVEGIGALRLVHTFQCQDFFRQQIRVMQKKYIETMQKLNSRMSLLGPISDSVLLIGLGFFLLLGFFLFKGERSTLLPDLLTFIAVLNRLSGKITQNSSTWSYIKLYLGRIGIVDDLLEVSQQESEEPGYLVVSDIRKSIVFKDIFLKYDSRQENALCGININWPAHTSLALVGPSGGGKSSIVDLLLGLYEPTGGSIQIDEQDLFCVNKASWRSMVGVVSQDTILFNASIEDNLLFAKPDSLEFELIQALKIADAWDFVSQLPQGIKTQIGERGFILSGGQRQRIAIARALLRKPKILILDEATSALDSQAEQNVQSTIDSLGRGTTRLIIAHRLSTIIGADQICVLDKGVIVEAGNHAELLSANGMYASLWRKQIGDNGALVF